MWAALYLHLYGCLFDSQRGATVIAQPFRNFLIDNTKSKFEFGRESRAMVAEARPRTRFIVFIVIASEAKPPRGRWASLAVEYSDSDPSRPSRICSNPEWRARHSGRYVTDLTSALFYVTGDARGCQSWGRGLLGDQAGWVEAQAISLRNRVVRAHQQAPVPSNGRGSLEKCQPRAFVSAPSNLSNICQYTIYMSPALS